jgi:hypothetical protein
MSDWKELYDQGWRTECIFGKHIAIAPSGSVYRRSYYNDAGENVSPYDCDHFLREDLLREERVAVGLLQKLDHKDVCEASARISRFPRA